MTAETWILGAILILQIAALHLMQKRDAAAQPSERLTPGDCECGHTRSSHEKGKGKCHGEWPPDEQTPQWTNCTCQLYIRDDDDDEDDGDTWSQAMSERRVQVPSGMIRKDG